MREGNSRHIENQPDHRLQECSQHIIRAPPHPIDTHQRDHGHSDAWNCLKDKDQALDSQQQNSEFGIRERHLVGWVGFWFLLPNAKDEPDGWLAQVVRKHEL